MKTLKDNWNRLEEKHYEDKKNKTYRYLDMLNETEAEEHNKMLLRRHLCIRWDFETNICLNLFQFSDPLILLMVCVLQYVVNNFGWADLFCLNLIVTSDKASQGSAGKELIC